LLIKIDVEGYELPVLEGAKKLLCQNYGYAQIESFEANRAASVIDKMAQCGWQLTDHIVDDWCSARCQFLISTFGSNWTQPSEDSYPLYHNGFIDKWLPREGTSNRWQVFRKYYLALPFRILRNLSRRLRQPIKDRMAAANLHQNSGRES